MAAAANNCDSCHVAVLGRLFCLLSMVVPRPTQLSIPSGSVNEDQLPYQLGRQRQVWFIPFVDKHVGVQVKLWNASTAPCLSISAVRFFTEECYVKYMIFTFLWFLATVHHVMLQSLLDLDHSHIRALLEADLSSAKGIQECTKAANTLLKCMSAEIHPCTNLFAVYQKQLFFLIRNTFLHFAGIY